MAAAGAEGWVDEGQVALGDGAVVAEAAAGEEGCVALELVALGDGAAVGEAEAAAGPAAVD